MGTPRLALPLSPDSPLPQVDYSLPIPPSPPQLANLQPYSHSAGLSNGGASTNNKLVAAVLLSALLHGALVALLINFGDLHLSSPNTTTPETTTLEIPLLPPGPTPPTPTPTPTATPKLATPTPQPTPLLTPSPLLVQSLPPEPAEPEELTLGLQDSPFTNTEVWQGFATNTSEQTARKGGVEQAALTPNPSPPPPTPATQPTPQEPTASPQPETPTTAQPEPLQPEPQQPQPQQSQPQQPEPQQTQPQQLNPPSPPTPAQPGLDATPTTTPPTPNELTLTPPIQPSPATPPQQLQPVQPNPQQPNPQQPNPQQPQPQQPNSPTPTPASTPNQPPPQPATQPTNTPSNTQNGAQAETESEATSIREAVDIRPGRPAAAKGLQINTVRPRWSTTTQLTALPKNPVVTVTFGRSGRVIHADYLRGQNTGYKEVDGPLIDALYRWTAKGDRLNTLPPTPANQKETQGLTISFRIILRND